MLNGQKTWTLAAHVADHLLVLTRTSAESKKHDGLTLLVAPTNASGLEIRAIGAKEAHTVNDLFFTDVYVPAENFIGQVGRAWNHLMRGLSVERLITAAMSVGADDLRRNQRDPT